LFKIIRAAITPGIQPKHVKIKTIKTEPHPLSMIAKGGNKIESKTLQKLIAVVKLQNYDYLIYRSTAFCFVTLLKKLF
tara:strand:+ start:12488 stop:12721 length:234 start_codon:yes stop_codon:yes gene_type:complete